MRLVPLLLLLSIVSYSQPNKVYKNATERPKLVVGIVVDQMRWDYLYRYYNRYSPGGFRRLIDQGFSAENTFINYIPTVTGCGHACLYTGSVPAINGIAGNEWIDINTKKIVYCAGDTTVSGVGTTSNAGRMSPRNMLVTTICDELKLATNFRSKVIGIAFKDRGAILPAGHSADAAYWYDAATGNFITSTYYMQSLPQWVTEFNNKKLPDTYFKKGWNTLKPIETYTQSTKDEVKWEGTPLGADQRGFPYNLEKFIGSTNYNALTFTPYGNTLTKDMAMAAVTAEQLGKDDITDFLAISFSTPDYIGHAFGPNSIEAEDGFLRLDRDLADLFSFLDKTVGNNQYLVFLSADHGAAHSGGFSMNYKLPGGSVEYGLLEKGVDSVLSARFGNFRLRYGAENYQLHFDHRLIDSLKLDKEDVYETAIRYLLKQPDVEQAFALDDIMETSLPEHIKAQAINGYHPKRSGDVQVILKAGYMHGGATGTTHGSWNPYDSHIPLLFYGWKVKAGKTNRETYMTDAAPTIAAMLRIQMPSGCVGKVIEEVSGR
jgi:predicted AlkP superfamily pyrophosphatase or phosphodiesterase